MTTADTPVPTSESGFGLVEAAIATFITLIGVLSVATLFMAGARMQHNAVSGSAAVGLVTAELERIRNLASTAAEREDGGSLTADVDDHVVVRGTTRIRWQIVDKPTLCAPIGGVPGAALECAKDISVQAFSDNDQAISPTIVSVLFR
jgi:hypothetical protein